jgi:hypothetical protein
MLWLATLDTAETFSLVGRRTGEGFGILPETTNQENVMQAVMQPRLVKVATAAPRVNVIRTQSAKESVAVKRGSRFLSVLLSALSSWAA